MVYREWFLGIRRRMPNGFWRRPENLRAVLLHLWKQERLRLIDVPAVCRTEWFLTHGLGSVLAVYRGSPWLILNTAFPGRWSVEEFPQLPCKDIKLQAAQTSGLRPDSETGAAGNDLRFPPEVIRHNPDSLAINL